MVLLKNDHAELTLNPATLSHIAVLGHFASEAMTGGGPHVVQLYTVNAVTAIQERVGSKIKLDFVNGKHLDQVVSIAHLPKQRMKSSSWWTTGKRRDEIILSILPSIKTN